MKTLSKLLIPCLGLICLLSGCEIVDNFPYYETSYTYKNECSTDVTMNVVLTEEIIKTVIPKDSLQTMKMMSVNTLAVSPFCYSHWSELKRITISNGIVELVQVGSNNTGILDNANYKLIESSESLKHYEYTFTDNFFENGTPIEIE